MDGARPVAALPRLRVASAAGTCLLALGLLAEVRRRRRRDLRAGGAAAAPLALSTTEAHVVLSAEGLPYRLLVSLPLSYHRSGGSARFPVMYALDGEPYLFPLLATAARTQHFFRRTSWHPDVIVVGICADLEGEFTDPDARGQAAVDVRRLWDGLRATRARDYLPTAAESPWGAPGADSLLHVSGHAATFSRCLAEVLVPFVDGQYRTEPAQRALAGKSFGGSGVAAALLQPDCAALFSHFLLCSPSLAWDEQAWFRLEAESRAARPPLRAEVLVCAGGEADVDVGMLERFRDALMSRGDPLTCELQVVPGESHGSVSYTFAARALAWLTASLAARRG